MAARPARLRSRAGDPRYYTWLAKQLTESHVNFPSSACDLALRPFWVVCPTEFRDSSVWPEVGRAHGTDGSFDFIGRRSSLRWEGKHCRTAVCCTTAQAVCRWLLTAEAWVHSQTSGWSETRVGFSRSYSFFPVSIISPLLNIHSCIT